VVEVETPADLVAEVRRWLSGQTTGEEPSLEAEGARREREVREVLAAIKGPDSRRFVRELAAAVVRGASA
jgi:hypothetical protein